MVWDLTENFRVNFSVRIRLIKNNLGTGSLKRVTVSVGKCVCV